MTIKDNNRNRINIKNIESVSITINALERIENLLDKIILLQGIEQKKTPVNDYSNEIKKR